MNCFITGVSSGIGRELVRLFVQRHDNVWGVARRFELLESLSASVDSDRFRFTVADLAAEKDVHRVLDEMRSASFVPDVVVLNAVAVSSKGFDEVWYDEYARVQAVNVDSVLKMTEVFLPTMLERRSGTFILVSSTAAFRPVIDDLALSSTKAAGAMIFRGLALRYKNSGVRFKTVHFGPIATDVSPDYQRRAATIPWKWFIPGPRPAAQHILSLVESDKQTSFYPFVTTVLFRCMRLFPDRFFWNVSAVLKNKTI